MTPKTEEELAEMVRGATGPLRIAGGGTRSIGQTEGAPLSTANLSGITIYDPGALTIVARAGTPVAKIEKTLAKDNQRLAFEPMDHRGLLGTKGTPTIGGVVAGNISGARRIAMGACRDFMLGVRFVDGAGNITSNGGRVMKNVTGYDLVKLMTGSYGTLGVLTEVSLKVLPRPETSATLSLDGLTPERAVAAMSTALGSPFEVTGAAHDGRTRIRIEGFADSVAYRTTRLREALAGFGPVEVTGSAQESETIWQAITDVTSLADETGDIWRVSVKPSDAPSVLATLPEGPRLLDWGGGLIWAAVPEGHDPRPALAGIRGHATRVRGTGPGAFPPEPAPLAALTAGLRAKFDPRGILNPGLMN